MSFKTRLACTLATAALMGAAPLAAPMSAQAQSVTLKPTTDGLSASIRLTTPTTRFRFQDAGVARDDWTAPTRDAQTRDARLSGDAVEGTGDAFDRFTLLLKPDTTEEGRGYIAVTRVGDGYLLFAPALTGADDTLQLTLDAPQGWTLWPANDVSGYVYVGPAARIEQRVGGAAIMAPGLSPQVRTTALDTFDTAVNFFGHRFGAPPKPPTLVFTDQGAGPISFRGDVTDTEVISARLHGDDWAEPTDSALSDIRLLVFHESVHLWNSHFAVPAEGSPWLHEGGAQYLALVAASSTGVLNHEDGLDAISASLTNCRRAVGQSRSLAERIAGGPAMYDCGVTIQWLADLELRHASNGQRGVIDVWRDLIAQARAGRPDYGPADFVSALPAGSAVPALFDAPADQRWSALEARLTALGVRWENRPSRQTYLMAALSHLNASNCAPGVSKGYYLRDGYVQMDNDAACGALAGDLELGKIEGFDPMADARPMFEAVQTRCAAGEPVRFTARGQTMVREALCKTPLATPLAYALTIAPPLATQD